MTKEDIRNLVEASSTIASLTVNYYYELQKLGCSHEVCIELAMAYQDSLIKVNA